MNMISSEKLLKSLIAKVPWQVSLGAGGVLSMEFGPHDPRQSGTRIHGEWGLWLSICSWRIESFDSILVASDDDADIARRLLRQLKWTQVLDISLKRPSLDLSLTFEDKRQLISFATTSSDEQAEKWILFTPLLKSLIAKGNDLIVEDYPLDLRQPEVAPGQTG